jgi:hypothetical protein
MNRITVSLIVVFALLMVSLNLGYLPASTVKAARPAGEDLYIKDTPADTGVEPNPDAGPMWVTEDIWVRNTPDPGYQPYPFPEVSPPWIPLAHENPEYRDPKFSVPNYVYVRIRNRGTSPSNGTERLRLYWAKASTGLSWPTQWGGAGTDFLANNCGPTKLYGAEVTKPRKNAGRATAAERDAYRDAILNIGQSAFVFPAWGTSYWHKQNGVHVSSPSVKHGSPAFLPWHREYLNRYEILLQESNPTVKLMYWDWTTDPENSTNGFNFYPGFMGASGRGTGGVSIGAPFNPGAPPTLTPPAVSRNLNPSTTPPADSDATLLAKVAFGPFAPLSNAFAWDLEKVPNHNSVHGYIGGGGNMSSTTTAAQDPFFFLLHGNVDRLWAQWQRNPLSLTRLDSGTAYDTEAGNAAIMADMIPWNGGTSVPLDPWTAAGGYIVNKTPSDPSVVSPPVYDCAPLIIPVLQPGEAVVMQIPWYPPNPADFACFGGDQGHVCLLGRVETSAAKPCMEPAAPFGMTFPEGVDVNANTRNNNNIAWKNVTVVDSFPGALRMTSILIRNPFRERVTAGLRFAVANEIGATFFDHGRVMVSLKPDLLKRWRDGGARGEGIKLQDEKDGRIEITSAKAFLQNIRLQPGEVFSVDVEFELSKNYRPLRGVSPKLDLIQTGTPGKPDEVVGGQRFIIDLSKLVLVKAGADWRYLDNGTSPGPKWKEPEFDDTKWRLGKAELGFGDNPATTIDGGPPDRRRTTTYFRRTFEVTDPSFFKSLMMRLKRDDGAVVYLNGKEIDRVNLPAGSVAPATLATRDVAGLEEEMFFPITLDTGLLRPGGNVIAVEIHQNSSRSPDLSFDLELFGNPAFKGFPPDLAFVSLSNGELKQLGEVIPINVEALDSDGKVVSVALFADGKLIGTDDQAPFNFQWRGASLGPHKLRAVALDNDQQRSLFDTTVSVLKNVPPSVRLTLPLDGASFRAGQSIAAIAEATDRLGKIERVDFYVRDADLFDAPDRLMGTAKKFPFSITFKGLAPGHYMLTAIAFDNGGLADQSIPIHIEVMGQHRD